MKKIIIICIVGILLSTAFGAVAVTNNGQIKDDKNQNSRATHTVFGEYGTATWCGYCKFAHGALKEIYAEGQYDFYYVSLVTDKNAKANQRCGEYNIYGYPTVWFDGGYKVNVGAGSIPSAKSAYISSITQCGNRVVQDVDVTVFATWLGGTNMEIEATVTNNEAEEYGGHVRVYITEKVSSMGWIDTAGQPYTFPFLDYAFNEDLTIPAGDSWTDTIQWDGTAHGFPSITENNIMIIAAVFNDEWHQGYSYPPSSNPFDAYYVDDAAAFDFGGGPNTPYDPTPADGATNVDINADISWKGGPGTTIDYDVYFGTTSQPPKVSSNQSATTYNPGTLAYDTTYYWKIVAWDQNQNSAPGPLWSFTTGILPNTAPNTPTITGPEKGKPGSTYKYTITDTDPDDDMVSAYVMWGDDTITDWTEFHDSGESFSVTHTWADKGTYTVQVKVKDIHGAESDWATLDVRIPMSYEATHPFLTWFFGQFPNAFPLLRTLLGF
jgi:glutaredoxin